jgi:hypothetical protein
MATGRYHWSNGAYGARFFAINAVACLPILALILHPSWFLLYVALGVIAVFVYIEKFLKMSISAFYRSLNITLTGRVKSSLNLIKELSR